jgi:hypothetical protein
MNGLWIRLAFRDAPPIRDLGGKFVDALGEHVRSGATRRIRLTGPDDSMSNSQSSSSTTTTWAPLYLRPSAPMRTRSGSSRSSCDVHASQSCRRPWPSGRSCSEWRAEETVDARARRRV